MSTYYDDDDDDQPRRYRTVQTRQRERGEPDYVREETYVERGKGAGPRNTDLVRRGRDDSIEDIPRNFPPPGRSEDRRSTYRSEYDYDDRTSRRARSVGGRRYSDDYSDYEDRRTEYTGYGGRGKDRRRRRDDRDDDSDRSYSPPPKNERRKSGIEDVLGGLGLGGIAAALTGKKDKDKDRDRSPARSARSGRSRSRAASRKRRSSSEGSDRSRGGGKKDTERKWAQAAQAALVAGAIEAFRSRKEPGPWQGEKGKRIATAAVSAGGIDGLLDRNPNEKTKRHLAEAVIGGLAANRLANGPRSKSRGRDARDPSFSPDGRAPRSRSRSIISRFRGRSQSRGRSEAGDGGGGGGGLKALAGGAAVAAAGTALYNKVRSKSRKRSPSRGSSADSYVPSRNRRGEARRSPPSDTASTRRSRGGLDRGRDPASRDINGGSGDALAAGAAGGGALAASSGGASQADDSNKRDASNDSSSTTDMEKKRKHMRGKELLTAGLATIATIHAAHGVYSSMEAHEKRHKLVAEGEMSPEEARKKQTKAWVQDAAAVGIAALGIKGAFSEWKEMKEQRNEIHEIEKRKRERRKRTLRRQKEEEKARHERLMALAQQNPQLALMQNSLMQQGSQNGASPMPMPNMTQFPQQAAAQAGGIDSQPPVTDNSGNPYAGRDRY